MSGINHELAPPLLATGRLLFLAIVSHSAADLDFDLQESASKCEGPLKDVKNLLRGKNVFL